MNLKQLFDASYSVIAGFEIELKDFRLEEAEEKPDGTFNIVVSYLIEDKNKPINMGMLTMSHNQRNFTRIFKRLIFTKDLNFQKLSIYKD